MNISLDEIMVNISGLVQSPPTALPVPTTNQQVKKKSQIKRDRDNQSYMQLSDD